MKKQPWIFAFLLLCLGFSSMGQVNFNAKVNRSHVGANERFTLQFTVNAESSNFEPPPLDDFRVLGGPNRSTSMRIINFERSVEHTYSYVLMPREPGNFSIGRASVKVDGETYYSNPLEIKVSRESPRASDPNDPYAQAAQRAFFRVLASQTKVYRGEPFVASYKLYFDTDLGQPQILDEPEFTGFYRSNLESNRISTQTETYRGKQYNTGIVRQMVLIPQQTGTLKPGAVQMQIPTRIPTGRTDIFGRRMARTINQTLSENFPNIVVEPLPEKGKPSSYDGAVGDFNLSMTVSRNEVSANESLSLTVKLSGNGNIKLIDAPEPEIPSAFEVYDPKYSEDIRVSASGMSGTKTYEYLLVPRYGGTYKIPELQFSYFDPQLERYHTLSSPEIEVKVTGGQPQPQANGGITYTDKEDVKFIGKEILFIKTSHDDFEPIGKNFLGSPLFYGLLGGIGVTWAGIIGFFFFSRSRRSDQSSLRSQKAGKKARKHLSQAKKALSRENTEVFYQELSSALWGYFADKFSIPQSRLSKDLIKERLQQQGLEPQVIENSINLMNRAEMARFTAVGSHSPTEDYNQATNLLTEIENRI